MSETEDAFLRRRRKFGLGVACALGGVGLGLTLVAVPFVLPALRRYCLPYVPATPEHIEYVLLQLKGRTGKVVDLGSGDGRLVCVHFLLLIEPCYIIPLNSDLNISPNYETALKRSALLIL